MNLPRFSVNRPIFTTMVTFIFVILGAFSLSRLQIDMLPNIELPTLTIRTDYEGASPEVMERLVTQIVEEIVATVPGIEEITSTSSEGRSSVSVSFVWGTAIDTAMAAIVTVSTKVGTTQNRTATQSPPPPTHKGVRQTAGVSPPVKKSTRISVGQDLSWRAPVKNSQHRF